MKKLVLVMAAFFVAGLVNAQTSADGKTPPAAPEVKDVSKYFEFKNADYDFGKIPMGKPVEYELSIKNISKEPATLDNVVVSCGCTTPKYDKGKIFAPGETIKVTLGFNGSAQGVFSRSVTIFLNGGSISKPITFKGDGYVVPASSAPANVATEKIKPANS